MAVWRLVAVPMLSLFGGYLTHFLTTRRWLGEHEHWGLQDPAAFAGSDEEKLAAFIEARNDIEGRIREWLAAHGHGS